MMRLTEIVHARLADHLQAGDLAIDATAGNGHDSCFLAEKVGASGRIIAIDIQEDALAATRARLESTGLVERVELVLGDHAQHLGDLAHTQPSSAAAVLFNLGYLPGGDKSITTVSHNTRRALESARALLQSGGLLCVTAYRGHKGGLEEAATVEAWMRNWADLGDSIESHVPETTNQPPILWLLWKPLTVPAFRPSSGPQRRGDK
jgi:precorrin-6B methylase 2